MRPYRFKDEQGNVFAEGLILSDGRCFISFIKSDYTFVYDNEDQLKIMHGNNDKNTIDFTYP